MNLLKDLKQDPGISMIFITHDIGLASDLCDRIAVTYAGEQMEPARPSGCWSRRATRTPGSCWPVCRACIGRSTPPRCPAIRPTSPRSRQGAAFTPAVPTSLRPCLNHPPPSPCRMAGMHAAG